VSSEQQDTPVVDAEQAQGLMGALLKVQQEAPRLVKEAEAKITSSKGTSFSYRYVPLDVLMEAIQPILTKNELVWISLPCRDEQNQPALKYRLTHVPSGEEIEETMPLVLTTQQDPKGHGSAITYARRYAITAVLNLSASKDDDGDAAGARRKQKKPKGDAPRLLTADERAKVLKAIEDAGNTEAGLAMLLGAVRAESVESLTTAHAFELRKILDERAAA
jgi:ERF superfamily